MPKFLFNQTDDLQGSDPLSYSNKFNFKQLDSTVSPIETLSNSKLPMHVLFMKWAHLTFDNIKGVDNLDWGVSMCQKSSDLSELALTLSWSEANRIVSWVKIIAELVKLDSQSHFPVVSSIREM